jgi:hypothetical protein
MRSGRLFSRNFDSTCRQPHTSSQSAKFFIKHWRCLVAVVEDRLGRIPISINFSFAVNQDGSTSMRWLRSQFSHWPWSAKNLCNRIEKLPYYRPIVFEASIVLFVMPICSMKIRIKLIIYQSTKLFVLTCVRSWRQSLIPLYTIWGVTGDPDNQIIIPGCLVRLVFSLF